MKGYRIKILEITPRLLLDLLTEKRSYRCLKGIPEGATVMYADPNANPASPDIKILITHPSFPEVPGDTEVPVVDAPVVVPTKGGYP